MSLLGWKDDEPLAAVSPTRGLISFAELDVIRPFPTTDLIDNFNRADENPLDGFGGWSSPGFQTYDPCKVLSNIVAPTGALSDGYRNSVTYSAVEVWATIVAKPEDNTLVALTARLTNPGGANTDCYALAVFTRTGLDDQVIIVRVDDGIGTTIAEFIQEITEGDSVGLRAEGGTLETWFKPAVGSWTFLGNVVDNTYPGPGFIGLDIESTNGRWDNFGGGTINTAGQAQATRGRIAVTEFEVLSLATRGLVSQAELEFPFAPTRGLMSYAELELPFTLTRGLLSWTELQVPDELIGVGNRILLTELLQILEIRDMRN